jgi:hypothetical protein
VNAYITVWASVTELTSICEFLDHLGLPFQQEREYVSHSQRDRLLKLYSNKQAKPGLSVKALRIGCEFRDDFDL